MTRRDDQKGAPEQLSLPYRQARRVRNVGDAAPLAVRVSQAARMVGLGRSKFYELIAAGDVETVKIGRCTLVPIESLHELIEKAREGLL